MTRYMLDTEVILLVEDQEDDVMLVQRAFRKAHLRNPLRVVRNGEEAVAYLRGEAPYTNREEYPAPTVVLLDLKMPRKDGFEVLEWIRRQPDLAALRVVVLTGSDQIKDVSRAYELGANCYLVKPSDFDDLTTMILSLSGLALDESGP